LVKREDKMENDKINKSTKKLKAALKSLFLAAILVFGIAFLLWVSWPTCFKILSKIFYIDTDAINIGYWEFLIATIFLSSLRKAIFGISDVDNKNSKIKDLVIKLLESELLKNEARGK